MTLAMPQIASFIRRAARALVTAMLFVCVSAANAQPATARMSLVAHADMTRLFKGDVSRFRWQLVASRERIATTEVSNGVRYNLPINGNSRDGSLKGDEFPGATFSRFAALGETVTVEFEAGTYDWLILTDINGDGIADSWHGSLTNNISQERVEFLPGRHYRVTIEKNGFVRMSVE